MLLKTTAEARAVMPRLLAKMNNNTLLPNMTRAAQKYLQPLTGKPMLDTLVTVYVAGNPPEPIATILKNAQLVVASHAFLDDLGTSVAHIGDAGLSSHQTAAQPRVYGWEFKAFKDALQDTAADAVDVLLQSLFDSKETLPEWTGSDAYKSRQALLIKTAAEFHEVHQLFQPQRTFWNLQSTIKQTQAQIFETVLGDSLVTYFCTQDLDAAETRILKDLQTSLAFFTIKKACEHNAVRISDAGFTISGMAGDSEGPTAGRSGTRLEAGTFILEKKLACERDGQAYMQKAKKALVTLSQANGVKAGFSAAFAASPLTTFDPSKKRDLGNGHRKGIFRL